MSAASHTAATSACGAPVNARSTAAIAEPVGEREGPEEVVFGHGCMIGRDHQPGINRCQCESSSLSSS